jgi:hypothetical protein
MSTDIRMFNVHLRFVMVKTYLVDLILATAHKKDGASMCTAFEAMIDKAENIYGVCIVAFCCDNDGGAQRGRKDLVLKRPWLFAPACCAHQVRQICHIHIGLC